ncbi:thioredoxin domain-containing protein [Klebsiella variicola]|uniref:hypothetical protein n=1 Tax=Klebsiella variicola TaxID=244366 RepID=UPI001D17A3A0|nr:hypothetical protein [Klebsiella variicola]
MRNNTCRHAGGVPLLRPDAAFAKDAGWQWYNEKLKPRDEDRKAAPAAPPPQMDILEKLATTPGGHQTVVVRSHSVSHPSENS